MNRFLTGLLALAFILTAPATLSAASLELSGPLEPGTAVLLTVKDFPPGSNIQGKLDGRAFPITWRQGTALIALDMETRPGKVTLEVRITPPKGKRETLRRRLTIAKRKYKEEHVTLPKKKVDLNRPDLSRAKGETAAIRATYDLRNSRTGFEEGFRLPVIGTRFSGVFGSRRVLNGKPRSPHNGVDIAAPKGTPVVTTAPGTVVLTGKDYFFTGNTVVVEHGHGVVSLYSHMDTITVREGEWLEAGKVIGTVGMTGRATGPHLHWGVLVRHARVDPLRLPGIRGTVAEPAGQ